MHPSSIRIADYTYHLPAERIATHPLPQRDASKLLVYKQGNISETIYRNIASELPPGSLMIFNDTKVIEARVLFQKSTGGVIEIFCLEPHERYKDITTAMLQQGSVWWKCMIGGASKWKHGMQLHKALKTGSSNILLTASIMERRPDSFIIEFSWTPAQLSFATVLHDAGLIPLPPYIKREPDINDKDRYQTVYAHADGSVAAPTAGLHFTHEVLHQLKEKNIQQAYVTLHVGAGTFKPVKTDTIAEHEMHAEFIHVNSSTIESILQYIDKKVIAVGTTSLRTIESLHWLGVKVIHDPQLQPAELSLQQWEAYQLSIAGISPEKALHALLQWMRGHKVTELTAKTQLLIVPGYKLQLADILVTNFHQPQSTLLLLVAAIAGPGWKAIYDYALQHDFRFLSYGDGCLIWSED
ncbi:MAG TPA: S-adenosylmethionine:tRNA ribosyltransferase-isomerase [Chitinophagaceae bacterium]|nr:S-adenosylmethionine:tRNA ribosyltransferase-isomerase [Chitinophagaceae bacterium]